MEATSLNQRVADFRGGSHVRRCHILRHNGDYTVGQHSHDMMSLLWLLWPSSPLGPVPPPIRLIWAIHHHDHPEGFIGDMPVPMKWFSKSLREEWARLELGVVHGLGLAPVMTQLGEEEWEWLDGLDKLELWLWGCDQTKMGNDFMEPMMEALEGWFDEADLPEPIRAFYEGYEWNPVQPVEELINGNRT